MLGDDASDERLSAYLAFAWRAVIDAAGVLDNYPISTD
jgi:hypothetical protein